MIPFVGFSPDLPPETPGVFVDCTAILPGIGSFSAAPSALDCSLGALDSAAIGFAVTRKLDSTSRVFAGSAAKLYEVSGTWADRTPYNTVPTLYPPGVYQPSSINIASFARASTATYFDSIGVLQTAAIDAQRMDYDPVTHVLRGLLIEESRTNLLTYSEQFDNAAWNPPSVPASVTQNADIAPDGSLTADRVFNPDGVTTYRRKNTISISPGAETYCGSVFIKKDPAATWDAQIAVVCDGGTTTPVSYLAFNPATGAVSRTPNSGGYGVQDCGDFWRAWATSTNNGTNPQVTFTIFPSRVAIASGYVVAWGAQVEVGESPTSYIPTTTAQATRAADVLNVYDRANYTLGPDDRWRFAQFGDVSLASSKSATIQAITTGTFADASGTAPKAAIIETANNQVFAFNIDGMGFGDDPTRWACSAIGDYTDWTPSVSTQCVSGQLLDSPGPITAGRRLGNIVVAYKDRAMYVGQYVGAPLVWDFQRVPGEIGAPCHEAVINTGTAHYFIGPDDFYIFDGTRPVPIPNNPCRAWFFGTYDQRFAYKICGTFDRINQRIYWYFPSIGSNGDLNKCIVFNVKTGQWGRDDRAIEFVAEYVSSGITYDQLGTLYATYDDLPTDISYDSPFWTTGSAVIAVFQTDHKAYQLSGTAGESRITTGHYGENIQFSTVSRVRPRFISSPTSSICNYSHSNTDASTFTQNITTTYANNWYDLIWSARWHKFEFVYQGNHAISGMDLLMSPDGTA